jgi:hypothetical protein
VGGVLVDIARADTVDAREAIEQLIEKRSSKEPDPDEREELWKASVRAHNERIHEENRAAWAAFHEGQAERHRRILEGLIAEHEAKAMKLLKGDA